MSPIKTIFVKRIESILFAILFVSLTGACAKESGPAKTENFYQDRSNDIVSDSGMKQAGCKFTKGDKFEFAIQCDELKGTSAAYKQISSIALYAGLSKRELDKKNLNTETVIGLMQRLNAAHDYLTDYRFSEDVKANSRGNTSARSLDELWSGFYRSLNLLATHLAVVDFQYHLPEHQALQHDANEINVSLFESSAIDPVLNEVSKLEMFVASFSQVRTLSTVEKRDVELMLRIIDRIKAAAVK